MTRLSIVVPAYNAQATIEDTLTALTGQRGLQTPAQIVVVDDGSTDATAERVRRFEQVELVQQANAGPGAARNAGVARATGELILFTDSDCVPAPDWAATLSAAFQDPQVALVMGRSITDRSHTYLTRVQEGSDLVARQAGPVTRFNTNNLALRSEVAHAMPFDPALRIYGEDTDLGWRVCTAGLQTHYCPEATLEHRHDHTYRSFLREGYMQGLGSARLHSKHGKWLPRDLLFGVLAVDFALLSFVPLLGVVAAALSAVSALLFLAALFFNELFYKRKGLLLALWTFPLQLLWYLYKLTGFVRMMARILLGLEPALRESKRSFMTQPGPSQPG